MNDAPAFDFKIGDPVTHNGKPYYWGPRSGNYRVLRFTPKGGGGILVDFAAIGKTIFPGTNEYGSYDDRHAVVLLYRDNIDLSIRVRVIQIDADSWIGGVDACYGEVTRRAGGLHPELPRYNSANQALTIQLRDVVNDLVKYGQQSDKAKEAAKEAMVKLMTTVAPEIREAVLVGTASV